MLRHADEMRCMRLGDNALDRSARYGVLERVENVLLTVAIQWIIQKGPVDKASSRRVCAGNAGKSFHVGDASRCTPARRGVDRYNSNGYFDTAALN